MTTPPQDWSRPHFVPGGGDADLFFVVYGPLPTDPNIARSRYRCEGVPPGVEVMSYGPTTRPEVVDKFRAGYLWEELQRRDATLAAEIAAQTECSIIRGLISDPPDLHYLRDVIGLIQWLLDSGGVGVFDPHSFQWMSVSDWHDSVFDTEWPSLQRHVLILASEVDNAEWLHTRGMRKFGRPDLSIHDVAPEHREAVVGMIQHFIEYQALGGRVAEGEEVRIEGLPAGMTCHHRGHVDDPDFNNRHVEIEWPDRVAKRQG